MSTVTTKSTTATKSTKLDTAIQTAITSNTNTEVSVVLSLQLAQKQGDGAALKAIFRMIGEMHKAITAQNKAQRATILERLTQYAVQCASGCQFVIGTGKKAEVISAGKVTVENAHKLRFRAIDGETVAFLPPTKEVNGKTLTWQPVSYNRKPNGWNGTGNDKAVKDFDYCVKSFVSMLAKHGQLASYDADKLQQAIDKATAQ